MAQVILYIHHIGTETQHLHNVYFPEWSLHIFNGQPRIYKGSSQIEVSGPGHSEGGSAGTTLVEAPSANCLAQGLCNKRRGTMCVLARMMAGHQGKIGEIRPNKMTSAHTDHSGIAANTHSAQLHR
jgi:hypothetical protein